MLWLAPVAPRPQHQRSTSSDCSCPPAPLQHFAATVRGISGRTVGVARVGVGHYYPPFASRAKGEVFVLLYVCLFVNDFSTTRGPIHAKVRMQAYSGSGRVFSPFGGWRPLAGGKRGK